MSKRKVILYSLIGLLLTASLLVTWLIATESGLRFVINKGIQAANQASLPQSKIEVEGISGSLITTVRINRFNLRQIEPKSSLLKNAVQANKIEIRCDLLPLLKRKLYCHQANIASLHLTPVESNSAAAEQAITTAQIKQWFDILDANFELDLKSIQLGRLTSPKLEAVPHLPIEAMNKLSINAVKWLHGQLSLSILGDVLAHGEHWQPLAFEPQSAAAPHQVALSLVAKKDTSHKVTMSVKGADIDFNLSTSGKIEQGSQLNITTQKPINSIVEGNWKYAADHFSITQGKLILDSLKLTRDDISTIDLNNTFNLNWPNLSIASDFNAHSNTYGDLFGTLSVEIDDLTSPLAQSHALVDAKGRISEAFFKSLNEKTLNQKVTTEAQSTQNYANQAKVVLLNKLSHQDIAIKIDAQAMNQQLNIDKLLLQLADNQLEAKASLHSSNPEQINANGRLSLPNFKLSDNERVNNTQFAWRIDTRGEQPSIAIDGSIGTVQVAEIYLNNLLIDAQIHQDLSIKTRAKKISIGHHKVTDLAWDASGTLEQHQHKVDLKTYRVADYLNTVLANSTQKNPLVQKSYAAKWDGSYSSSNNQTQYTLKNLEAFGDFLSRTESVKVARAELSSKTIKLKKLCIQSNGSACIDAAYQIDNAALSASANITAFDLHWLTRLKNRLQLPQIPELNGILNGQISVSTREKKITELKAHLNSQSIDIIYNTEPFNIQQLNLKSTDIDSEHSRLNFAAARIKLPNLVQYERAKDSERVSPIGPIALENLKLDANFNRQPEKLNLNDLDMGGFIIAHLDTESDQQLTKALPQQNVKAMNKGSAFLGPLYHHAPLNVALKQADQTLEGTLALTYPPHVEAKANAYINFAHQQPHIKSNATIDVKQLRFLQLYLPQINQISGQYQQQLTLDGELTQPTITGNGTLNIQQLLVQELGINIQQSLIDTKIDQKSAQLSGVVNTSLGALNVDGNMDYKPKVSAHLNVYGNQIQVLNNPNYQLIISPDVKTTFTENVLTSQGQVTINKAKLTIKKLPKANVMPSDDEIIVNQTQTDNTNKNLQYRFDIQAIIADKVEIDALGLKASATGRVRIQSQPSRLTRTEGKLKLVDGEFEIYKQKLKITQGHLDFLGAAENPNIYFKAERKVDDLKVGVIGEGSISTPKLQLFSEPAMPPEDIVALLVSGKRISALSEKGGNFLTNSVISLGVEEADKIAQKLGEKLGLKNLGVSSKNQADSTSIKIDSKINNRLSVGFGTVINAKQETQTGWVIEYSLSPNLTLEAQSGDEVNTMLTYKKTFDLDKKKEEGKKSSEEG